MTEFHDPVRGSDLTGGVVTAENVAAFNRSDDVVEVVLWVDWEGYVAPDAPALFRRSIPEIRARAATSRYWAQRLRWLRKRGRA